MLRSTLLTLLVWAAILTPSLIAQSGSISGTSWLDVNQNGLREADEPAQPCRVAITIRSGTVTIVAGPVETDENGYYRFDSLPFNRYDVSFEPISDTSLFPTDRIAGGGSDLYLTSTPANAYYAFGNIFESNPDAEVDAGWIAVDLCTDDTLTVRNEGTCGLMGQTGSGLFAQIDGNEDDYSFSWSNGASGNDGIIYTDRTGYSVTATNNNTGCVLINRAVIDVRPNVFFYDTLYISCGEASITYTLPEDIRSKIPNGIFRGFSRNSFSVAEAELTGELSFDREGKLWFRYDLGVCRITVLLQVYQAITPTDEFYLLPWRDGYDCDTPGALAVRNPDRPNSVLPNEVFTTSWYTDAGQHLGTYPGGFLGNLSPGIYYAVVTSPVCDVPPVTLSYTLGDPGSCDMLSGQLALLSSSAKSQEQDTIPIPEYPLTFSDVVSGRSITALTDKGGYYSLPQSADIDRYVPHPVLFPTVAAEVSPPLQSEMVNGRIRNADVYVRPTADCPTLRTSATLSDLTVGGEGTLWIKYDNLGTKVAKAASLAVRLDPAFILLDADAPTSTDGEHLLVDLGDVAAFTGGQVVVNFRLDEKAATGVAHSVRIQSAPDEVCVSPDGWSGGLVTVRRGACNGNEQRFIVANEGDAPTSASVDFIIYADKAVYQDSTLGVLAAGETRTIGVPADGRGYYLRASQEERAPASDSPTAFANGCGTDATGGFSTTDAALLRSGSDAPGSAFVMQRNGIFRPASDLTAYPVGDVVGNYGNVAPSTRIDYNVHFRNDGDDTVTTVIIVDTLPRQLLFSSLSFGASSHPYTVHQDTTGVLVFRFDDIALPPFETAGAKASGVVSFSLTIDGIHPPGTEFENRAYVQYDFGARQPTSYVRHRIEDFQPVSAPRTETPSLTFGISPNPGTGQHLLDLGQTTTGTITTTLFTLAGRRVWEQQFSANGTGRYALDLGDPTPGMYVLRARTDRGTGSRRIMIR